MKTTDQVVLSSYSVVLVLLYCTVMLIAFSPRPSLVASPHHVDRKSQTKHHIAPSIKKHWQRKNNLKNSVSKQMKVQCTRTSLNNSNENNQDSKEVVGVTLKMAFDASPLWGVAEQSPTSERFTSPESLDMVHRLRRESCAVLVGRGTVERDDCSLTVRRVEMDGDQPVRVLLDPQLKLLNDEKKEYTLLKDGLRTIIYHAVSNNGLEVIKKYACSDAVMLVEMAQHPISGSTESSGQQYTLSPAGIIQDLSSRGLTHIMVEGGPATAIQFLDAKLIDRAILVRAPIQFKAPIPAGFNQEKLKEAGLVMLGSEVMGGDTVEYWVREGMEWPTKDLNLWP